jgi:hypothetical protein
MDHITVTQLVQDRTTDLRRTADQVRQERVLRSTPSAEVVPVAVVPPTRPPASAAAHATGPALAPSSPAKAGGCAPPEPAL